MIRRTAQSFVCVAVLATAFRFALWRLEGRAVLPYRDPRLTEALGYESE